jgi:hypothetical protein
MKKMLGVLALALGTVSVSNAQGSTYPITIYVDCDYQGRSQELSEGYHDGSQLGIGSGTLSSLKLKSGYGVILYDQYGFRGHEDTWTNSVGCLGDFKKKTMSLYVYRTGNYSNNYPKASKGGGNSYPVTVYQDCDYNGNSQGLSAGYHDVNQLGIGGRNLSSLRLAPGYAITLYDKKGFTGGTDNWSNSVPCLGDFNDRTMSLYVYRTKEEGNSNSSNNSYGNGVAFFSDCNYSGMSTTLHEGAFSQSQMGIGDNTISSIKIPKGFSVLVFINDNFGGSMKNFTGDVKCIDPEWNDKISSVQISHNSN